DVVLDISREQDAPAADLAEQDDRDVVDSAAGVWWLARDAPGVRPEDAHLQVVNRQAVAGDERAPPRSPDAIQGCRPRRVAGARTAHPSLEHPADPVALEQH